MRTSALLAAALIVLTVTGCQTDDPTIVPQPEPSSTPLFASEEEALAAAEEAYAGYLAAIDAIAADGGSNPERLLEFATESAYEDELVGFENYQNNGTRGTGDTRFDHVSLQSADLSGFAVTDAIVIYVCEDYSGTDVLDSSGQSIAVPGRQSRFPVTVSLDATGEQVPLVVSSVDNWSGEDFCVD